MSTVIKNPISEKYRAWIYLAGIVIAVLATSAIGFLEAAGQTQFILPVATFSTAIGGLVAVLARVNLTSDDAVGVFPTEPTPTEVALLESLQAQERALVAALGADEEEEVEEEGTPVSTADAIAYRKELMRQAAELRDSKAKHLAE